MTAATLIALCLIAVAGARWRMLGLPAWLAGTALLAAATTAWISLAWMALYPFVLLAVSRRGRLHRGEDALGHLDSEKQEPIDPEIEMLRQRRVNETISNTFRQ